MIEKLIILGAILASLLIVGMVQAATWTLQWNPTDGATGYEVYYGSESGVYADPITVTTNSYSGEFPDGVRYFALKATNQWGKSPFSEEAVGLPDGPEWQLILMSNP